MANIVSPDLVVSDASDREQQNYTPALVSLAILYFMMGFITCLNDTLVPFFKKGFTLSYTDSSLVQFYFFLTYGIMSIPAGKIVERVGYKHGMVLGFAIAALGAFLFFPASLLHQYYLFLAALFVVAIGIVLLQVAANPYITVLGPAKTASSRLTLIQGVGSLGTTVAPLFGAYFILAPLQDTQVGSEAVRFPYLGIGLVLLLIALIVYFLSLPAIATRQEKRVEASGDTKTVFSFRNLNLGALAIFVYVGAEVSVGTFLTNYIADLLQITESESNTYVALYWGSMMVGRMIGYFGLKVYRPSVVLAACATLAIALILVSVSAEGYLAVWTMIAVGLCNSVMFAIIFSLSVSGLGTYTTRASGILSTAIAGGAIISFCQGVLIDNFSWTVAFMVPLACYVYILFYGLNGYKSRYSEMN
ncbi:sugar MFS transporter [Telluribacter sp. SYSU D00476]|uniref:sugar MFS transporter n=1 Tax=Telluribacter sp. SYSU D00476 TaxID=2811430 RepID=UPI001FF1DB61|nr:sugar MFS transporter [Telluribacter sp. SYSU D00476]